MAVRGSTRHVVAPSSINTSVFSGKKTIAAGAQTSEIIEIDLSTSDLYNDLASAVAPAGAAGNFHSSMGHLLEIFAHCELEGGEVRVDLAPNGDGGFTPAWRRAATILLTSGVPSSANLIRIPTSFARVTWVNNRVDATSIDIESSVKVRSI